MLNAHSFSLQSTEISKRMKKTVVSTLLLISVSTAPAYASFYVRGAAGLSMANDSDYHFSWDTIRIPGITGQRIDHGVESGTTVFKSGYLVNGAVGYDFGGFRLEGEIGYQDNGVKRFTGTIDQETNWAVWPPPAPIHESYDDDVSDLDISQTVLSYMVNGYVDINVHSPVITPYVTAGVGLASVTMRYDDPYGISSGSYSDDVFAWQIGAGLSFKLGNRSTIDVGYRYFATDDVNFNDNHYHDPGNTRSILKANHTVSSHHIMAGFRYSL